MPTKQIPAIGDSNWGVTLNNHLSQLQSSTTGGINTFEQFSDLPTNLTADDAGKTYLYTQTGNLHQWTGATWKVLNESVINVKDYGAVGDGVADDTMVIQFCLDNFVGKIIFVPTGVFIITKPLILPSQTILRGSSTQGTVIKKTTTTPDSNNIKAVIILKSEDNPNPSLVKYNSDSTLSDIFLFGGFTQNGTLIKNDYGIYADKCSTLKLEKVWMTYFNTGFYSSDCFLLNFSNMNISEGDFGITIETGTSLTASTVYCVNCTVAYNLKSLRYSTFNSCAADGASYIPYYFEVCQGITLNSCGAESTLSNGYSVYSVNYSNIIINAPFVLTTAFYEKGIINAYSNSQVLINNITIKASDESNKFITAETNSIVTLNELYNLSNSPASNLLLRGSYTKSDKFIELTGGVINKPIKESIFN
jgi:Pectate lyase superfamily protein